MELVAGCVLGFFGSLHCAGMCGPLALLLPGGAARRAVFLLGRVLYNAGRMTTYVVLGMLIGLAGRYVALAGFQRHLSIAAGVLVLATVLLPAGLRYFFSRSAPAVRLQGLIRGSVRALLQQRSLFSLYLIGVVNGFLPCGFVYVALAGAATTGAELSAALFMAGFGLGTLPVMLATSLLPAALPAPLRARMLRVMPVLTFLLAVWFVLRGLNLGIPYVSPRLASPESATEIHSGHAE